MNGRNKNANRSPAKWVLGLTVVFELFACVLRFGMKFESTRDTASTIGRITCGVRLHHGYVGGVMMLIACWFWQRYPHTSWWLLAVGLGLFLSDMTHHFLVLWLVCGSPQFDLMYPPTS